MSPGTNIVEALQNRYIWCPGSCSRRHLLHSREPLKLYRHHAGQSWAVLSVLMQLSHTGTSCDFASFTVTAPPTRLRAAARKVEAQSPGTRY